MKVSDKFTNLAGVAPLFCAGITTYSPMRAHQSKVGPGTVRFKYLNMIVNLTVRKLELLGLEDLDTWVSNLQLLWELK